MFDLISKELSWQQTQTSGAWLEWKVIRMWDYLMMEQNYNILRVLTDFGWRLFSPDKKILDKHHLVHWNIRKSFLSSLQLRRDSIADQMCSYFRTLLSLSYTFSEDLSWQVSLSLSTFLEELYVKWTARTEREWQRRMRVIMFRLKMNFMRRRSSEFPNSSSSSWLGGGGNRVERRRIIIKALCSW